MGVRKSKVDTQPQQKEIVVVNRLKFYIDGAWVDPVAPKTIPVINPATEEPLYDVALGSAADVDKAVNAARAAFETFGACDPVSE